MINKERVTSKKYPQKWPCGVKSIMKKIWLLGCIFLSFLFFSCIAFDENQMVDASLIVSENVLEDGVAKRKELYRYDFANGQLVNKEFLSTVETNVIFGPVLIDNHFISTSTGDIIDIFTGKITDFSGDRLEWGDGYVIYKSLRDEEDGVWYINLETMEKTRFDDSSKWYLPGQISPDGTKSIGEYRNNHEIYLFEHGKAPVCLGDGFTLWLAPDACSFPTIAAVWLNNDSFLAVKSDGAVVKVLLDGTQTELFKFKVEKKVWDRPHSPPYFFKINDGQLAFWYGIDYFIFNLENNTYSLIKDFYIGCGFSFQWERLNGFKRTYSYNGEKIGMVYSSDYCVQDNYIAVENRKKMKTFSRWTHTVGIKVWNSKSRKWVTIDIDWLDNIIGWMN